ncbi:uncharacterized protein LOC126379156 isoform X2 [Pectinophora gossypiella]|uniref:uncharacterized protein LOC126379156 isoform X2 n=1 Tax=Pectinophora gossypiella TaxID=13191 RepID=UPI00214F20F3|nr:uncharacterized protein LOC126379156 isoform X2 [Pectinophora gossypiella]
MRLEWSETKSLNLIAPILDVYERKGYCIAYLDSKVDGKRRAKRESVKITFDTKLKSKNNVEVPNGATVCKNIDEDPLNNCQPVDCEVFYNGKRPHYNRRLKRCVEVPPCINEGQSVVPTTIYDPVSNRCVGDEPLDQDDYEFVKKLAHGSRIAKDVVIINTFKDGVEENEVIDFKKDANNEDTVSFMKTGDVKRSCFVDALFDYINNHRSGLSLLGVIFLVQCGLICTMVYFLSKNCLCKRKNVLEKKFFNYRHDASVTTPLIGTTQVETETTCQFMSESSNIDKKIQCYKACQKDAKVSMSDDILSKCLNRRSWDRKEVKSDAMDFEKMKEISPKASRSDGSAKFETRFVSTKKQGDQKVNFENEKDKYSKGDSRKSKTAKSIAKKSESKQSERKRGHLGDSSTLEREIKCHSYNYVDSKVKEGKGFSDIGLSEEIKCHSYNYMSGSAYSGVKTPVPNKLKEEDSIVTLSAPEKGQASVQASIANDSIDDYLSERGVLYLAGENISKYSFSNDSDIKSVSSMSSKTSKNNIMKNVLSYLKRGSKHGPSSDPGTKKSKDALNLELIHISRVSMYSSSNNESSLKNLARMKDSRTSL